MLDELDKPKHPKSKPKKTGRKKKRINQGLLRREQARQRELEEEHRQKQQPPSKTIQSMGGAWQTQMLLSQSRLALI